VVNTPNDGTYKTLEFALNKRSTGRLSASASFGYTWQHDDPTGGYPNTPNGPADEDYSIYSAKANIIGNLLHGVLVNSYAAELISVATGPAFRRPTAVIAPRTARIGFRFMW
jgi:hypothetical protein